MTYQDLAAEALVSDRPLLYQLYRTQEVRDYEGKVTKAPEIVRLKHDQARHNDITDHQLGAGWHEYKMVVRTSKSPL